MNDRILTVRQPWAWAMLELPLPKNVENRTFRTRHRGTLWIHAGVAWSARGAQDERVKQCWVHGSTGGVVGDIQQDDPEFVFGGIIGRVEIVDCHPDVGSCCRPWGESAYVEAGGTRRRDIWHWVVEEPAALACPVPATGRLGLWRPDPDLERELARA